MHRSSIIAAVVAIPLLSIAPAHARGVSGTWCAGQTVGGDSWTENCSFSSFQACRREVTAGNRGICFENPHRTADRMGRAYGREHR